MTKLTVAFPNFATSPKKIVHAFITHTRFCVRQACINLNMCNSHAHLVLCQIYLNVSEQKTRKIEQTILQYNSSEHLTYPARIRNFMAVSVNGAPVCFRALPDTKLSLQCFKA